MALWLVRVRISPTSTDVSVLIYPYLTRKWRGYYHSCGRVLNRCLLGPFLLHYLRLRRLHHLLAHLLPPPHPLHLPLPPQLRNLNPPPPHLPLHCPIQDILCNDKITLGSSFRANNQSG